MKNILTLILFVCSAVGLSAQCLQTTACTNNLPVCDYTTNQADLWNESLWWDNLHQTHDLADVPCDLSSTAVDTCTGAVLTVKYLLFLDLNGDDTLETVIKSWNPPAPGTVNYNNYNTPNYDGGEPRIFDERAVPADQKYQFALKTETAGNTMTARLQWNTPSAPGVYTVAQLPYGAHKIQWVFEDNLSNEVTCDQNFITKDCKKPTIVCLNGLSVNIMPTGQIQLWASDFLQYGEDNATLSNMLEYGIRKTGAGTGFPVDGNGDPLLSVLYNCNELGTQIVELWARDASGNADYCETYVIVQDNADNCPGGGGTNETPVVICLNGISVHLTPSGTVQVSASSLLNAVYDDNTPSNLLDLGIRKSGTGSGFPVDGQGNPIGSVLFDDTELGVQLIDIWARDTDGNADFCQTYILVEENTGTGASPTVVCLNGLSINIMPTGMVQLWATDFLQYVEDDNTPSNLIDLGIRKVDTGTGFPEDASGNPIQSITFNCDELGTQLVELWARDLDGNADYCSTYALVQDNFGNCGGPMSVDETICIRRWCDDAIVSNVQIQMDVEHNFVPPFVIFDVNSIDPTGCYHLDSTFFALPLAGNYTIAPSKDDNPNNGVTTLDLVKISRHILGLEPLPSAYAMIAADANKSGSVTTFDIIENRKLIQGIYTELPNNTSWRFVNRDFVFPNPNNPFQSAFPESITIANVALDSMNQFDFVAIKVGDVDCDATPGALAPAHDRKIEFLTIPDRMLQANETVEIPVAFADAGAWLGIQAGLLFDPEEIEIETVVPGDLQDMELNSVAQPAPGILNCVWYTAQPQQVAAGETIFTLRLHARQPVQLSRALKLAHCNAETPRNLRAEGFDVHETPFNFELLYRNPETTTHATLNTVFPPQPNPTDGATRIPVKLAQTETVRVLLTDISGKRVWEQTLTLPAGMQMLEIPALAMPKAGIYGWQIQAGKTWSDGKLVRI